MEDHVSWSNVARIDFSQKGSIKNRNNSNALRKHGNAFRKITHNYSCQEAERTPAVMSSRRPYRKGKVYTIDGWKHIVGQGGSCRD